MALTLLATAASFSLSERLKAARFSAMSADLAAARPISSSDLRHLWSGSMWERIQEQWPMMLVRVLLRSSATERASWVARSTFCLMAGGGAAVSGLATRTVSVSDLGAAVGWPGPWSWKRKRL